MSLSTLTNENQTHILWSDVCQQKINNHINIEMSNFVTYEAMAAYLDNDRVGLTGLASKFRKEADEELKHARDFINYQNKRGGKIELIKYEQADISSLYDSDNIMLEAYTIALNLEKSTNQSLVDIHDNIDDSAFQDLIETYLHEQHQTQYEINTVIKLLELGGKTYNAIHESELREKS
jgi:ferritin